MNYEDNTQTRANWKNCNDLRMAIAKHSKEQSNIVWRCFTALRSENGDFLGEPFCNTTLKELVERVDEVFTLLHYRNLPFQMFSINPTPENLERYIKGEFNLY